MATIASVALPRDGEATIRAAAALTTSYVGSKKIPTRVGDIVEFLIYLTTQGSVTQLDAVTEYSLLADPNDDTKEAGETGAEWVRHKEESVSSGVVTQNDKNWRWTIGAATVVGFKVIARGNWMRLFVKANDGTSSVCSATVLIREGGSGEPGPAGPTGATGATGAAGADFVETAYDLGSLTGAKTANLANGTYQYGTTTGNTTWTFSGAAASGTVSSFTLALTNGGAFTQTWPASVDWPSGTAPTLTAAGLDLISFLTRDAGTTWLGSLVALDVR